MTGDLTIVFEPAEEGGFIATVPEIPGAFSQGETIDEAREMVLDAVKELLVYRRRKALAEMGPLSHVERVALVA